MRNSQLPAPSSPYAASGATNSDVIVSQSFDSGRTWSAPFALTLDGDQFMPWGAFDRAGILRIGFFDRRVRSRQPPVWLYAGHAGLRRRDAVQLQSADHGALGSNERGIDGLPTTANASFPFATTFLGDYSNIATTASGGVVAYWTDLRQQACFGGRCGSGQDAFFATAP